MLYAIVFFLFAVYLLVLAALLGGWAWLLLYPASSFFLFAAAYAGLGPGMLGKRHDGRLSWWALLLLGPVFLFVWAAWHMQRWLRRGNACHEVAPGLWLGRRPFAHELPAGVVLIIDLTAELPVSRGIQTGERVYITLPTLDGMAPDEDAFRALVLQVAQHTGPVYVHCAMGLGRSALLAAAILLARGLAVDALDAERQLRQIRPGVRLRPAQRRLLRRLDAEKR